MNVERRYYDPYFETMSRDDLLSYQWQMLKRQVEYTYARSGLCQRQFKAAGITPDDIKTRVDFLKKVPFTTKRDIVDDQQTSPPYGSRLAVPENEVWATSLTSGTSGKGQEVYAHTREDWEFYSAGLCMIYSWVGWQKGDRVMNPIPYGLSSGGFGNTLGMQRLGLNVFNTGTYDTRTKIAFLKRFRITGLLTVPAYLATLTQEAEGLGYDLARDFSLRQVLIVAAAYPVSFIHKMEAKWSARIYDYYGSSQSAVGSNCEKGAVQGDTRGFYHLLQHRAYHEVINPETGEHVRPGEEGELIVTPLSRKASPFLRFRSADRVRYFPHTACDCGRSFDLLEAGTITRYDDMMKIKGANVWPETIDETVLTTEEVAEYQGRLYISEDQKEKAGIAVEFKAGVATEVKERLLARLSDELREKTGLNFIMVEARDTLPRFDFKARRWTDERIRGLAGT